MYCVLLSILVIIIIIIIIFFGKDILNNDGQQWRNNGTCKLCLSYYV